ncbi:UvrD-helicase domain-containing protein [Paenibacillus lycopersici]|uniref:UvrD-helicase domain-containing protein n=1 Tax=Paenibacillus lycopersici TaxID=2704462 RepID=A0A6C0FT87_9BACL|nr:RNA polymerase recycling motor HelD [Paenibacillus lycopersici]QHT58543.1 UvrD-helicase domain-containing protein [Paenibacillus lycopersici]
MRNAEDWRQEQERLDFVTGRLRAKIAELEPEADQLHDQAADIRKRFWEEVTVNTSSHEDFEESYFTVRQQAAILSERERTHRLLVQQWRNLNRLLPSPYFGRIDFREDGSAVSEQVYIGVSSFVDEANLSFLVYDWRTPMASMYYDHSPGPAAFEAPGGRIAGEVTLKRQYRIRDGRLRNLFDASVTIGDELLQAVLGQGANDQMKSIVATIQKEQNAIIRDDRSRMLIVQGAAGSGKTSAALQRVAYLLYKHRERLKADQIVLFSPNPMFNSYVSTVLPELGEENMQQTTFQEYLDYWLGSAYMLEDPFDQLEYVLAERSAPGYEARLSGIRHKSSEAFLRTLQRYALRLGSAGMRFHAIRFRDRELIGAERIAAQFYGGGNGDASVRLDNRVTALMEWLLRELTALERLEREADWVQEELDYLDNEQYANAYQALNREEAVFDFTEKLVQLYGDLPVRRQPDDFDYAQQEEELLRRSVVKERFRAVRRSVRRLAFIDMNGLYAQLFADGVYQEIAGEEGLPAHWPEICGQTAAKLSRHELFYEDATPYLYLKELVEGVRTNTDVRHIFVDEGQDYSMFQYEFLKKLFPRARMTVLGDFGQAIFTQSTELREADSPLVRLYGEADTTRFTLVRSYRSTREIVAFTRALLPQGGEIVPFERSGGKPTLAKTAGGCEAAQRMAADVAALRAEGFASIAVITRTAAESDGAYAQLAAASCEALRLVTKHTPVFEKGTMVMPAYLAKGVEFDAVLIFDASARTYRHESERKLFYTACTRAMHRLLLYSAGEWSPFVRELDASLYEAAQ